MNDLTVFLIFLSICIVLAVWISALVEIVREHRSFMRLMKAQLELIEAQIKELEKDGNIS